MCVCSVGDAMTYHRLSRTSFSTTPFLVSFSLSHTHNNCLLYPLLTSPLSLPFSSPDLSTSSYLSLALPLPPPSPIYTPLSLSLSLSLSSSSKQDKTQMGLLCVILSLIMMKRGTITEGKISACIFRKYELLLTHSNSVS